MPSTDQSPQHIPDSEIAAQLIAALRGRTGQSNLQYSAPPARLAGGYETVTCGFELTDHVPDHLAGKLVLRLFNSPGDAGQSRRETAVQNSLADLGYPVPRVFEQFDSGIGGRPFIVMQRVTGRPMMETASPDPVNAQRVIDWLATVHARLHEIPSEPVIRAIEAAGFPRTGFSLDARLRFMERYFESETLSALRPGMDWLLQNRPEEQEQPAVCHGDFHPGNIMVEGGEVSGVIDWPGTAFADPELDVATSIVLIKVGAALVEPQIAPMAGQMAAAYVARYDQIRPLDMNKVDYYEVLRSFRAFTRATALRTPGIDPHLAPRDQYPWASHFAMTTLRTRLGEITGIEFPLPSGIG